MGNKYEVKEVGIAEIKRLLSKTQDQKIIWRKLPNGEVMEFNVEKDICRSSIDKLEGKNCLLVILAKKDWYLLYGTDTVSTSVDIVSNDPDLIIALWETWKNILEDT